MGQTAEINGTTTPPPQILVAPAPSGRPGGISPPPPAALRSPTLRVPPAAASQDCSQPPGRHPLRSRDSRDAPNGKQRRPKGCKAQAALTPNPDKGDDIDDIGLEKPVDWGT